MDYGWIQPGVKVRIKTVAEILKMYPREMPYSLTDEMKDFCGTIQIVEWVGDRSYRSDCKMCVSICSFSWPETVLTKPTSKLGNTY